MTLLTTPPAITTDERTDTLASVQPRGHVYLIGAGPGDPDLITVRGLRCLRAAEVVIYDRLLDPALLREVQPGATLIYAGKGPGCHTLPQEQINAILVEQGLRGRVVARLKGGDPFVFGRGGEEVAALIAAGISYEIIPGVSAAIAAPAYAGIPVTHRDHAPLVTIVTGHEAGARATAGVDWEALAALGGTLVVMMGVAALPRIIERLRTGGLNPQTPVAVIQNGTTPSQRVASGTLDSIVERAQAAGISSPATTVIGAVAALHHEMAWFDPLRSALAEHETHS